jgi:hypothetical protein
MKELAATGAGAGEIRAPAAARAGEASPQSSLVQSSREGGEKRIGGSRGGKGGTRERDLTHWSARKMSRISPSTCSSSGLMGTSLAMAGWLDPLLYPVSCGSRRRRLLCLVRCGAAPSPRHSGGGGWSRRGRRREERKANSGRWFGLFGGRASRC